MPNIFKARCKCGSRAAIIRSEMLGVQTLLTVHCDNVDCQRVFRVCMEEHDELLPPVKKSESKPLVSLQLSF